VDVPDDGTSLVFAESNMLQEAAGGYEPDRGKEQEANNSVG